MSSEVTLSYSHGASTTPLLGETIGANLERTVARFPDHEALVSRHQGVRYTYAELDAAVDEIARGLMDLGIRVRGGDAPQAGADRLAQQRGR